MNILVIGSGGREHALAWKIRQSPCCDKLYIAPGNAGTAQEGENVLYDISYSRKEDRQRVIKFCEERDVELVVVGPDDWLAHGMVDELSEAGVKAFGPTRAAARLEWSKAFAKDFMRRHNIPTASSRTFSSRDALYPYMDTVRFPVVIKADGLALGKGVVIAETREEAEKTLRDFMSGDLFGDAGKTVVIEEFLEGTEVSVHAFCDGKTAKLFPVSRDHKRVFDGNRGPNTGGMGTIAPVPNLPENFLGEVNEKIVMPVIAGMAAEGAPFRGVLYPGLMLTKDGPKVLEFNARFGDPECQSYMRLLEFDLVDIMLSCMEENLAEQEIRWSQNSAVTVVLASKGYPGKYEKGFPVEGLSEAARAPSVVIFHAGTKREGERVITSGGRVLGVSAVAETLAEARQRAYAAAHKKKFVGKQYRTDIGK